ncbi:hypothetical protein BUALT_Bualt08G0053900 [Buddleja alternifolia]|uniref:Alpha/beta hydrolase fold-3 domain-containing protein n=1 Tax=Buddleja alternifolia TaxID=168488 RepID=A0AAV6X3X5_9LAMI|nr:hypothetical protein BUALT_Bualt08G0053900 [Buddleja alternifolia]
METIDEKKVVIHDVPPYLRVYKDGTIERLLGTGIAPPSLDPVTGVSSKDVVFQPETGVSVRFYRPPNHHHRKLPLVVYFHGGAFCISSKADPLYHHMLNLLVKEANVILVSVDYRLAPENPLPAAYDDSYAALKWVAAHNSNGAAPTESWLTEFADFNKVFLAGDSAGANISHHMAIRVGSDPGRVGLKISGVLMVHPYFWGEEAIGAEAENPFFKAVVDEWWRFVCPSDRGCDDPLINPFVSGAPSVAGLACDRILVCVAGNDILRERGRLYYESVAKSKWEGKAEYCETQGEDHVFHIIDPTTQNSINLINRCAEFINHHS